MAADRRGLLFWMVLAVAVALAAWASMPPPPRATDNNIGFSVKRALTDLREITRAPHPSGSAENARVRDVLVARLKAMGLQTELQSGTAVRQSPRDARPVAVAPVSNIVAVLPGLDRSQPAVAVMAHYDSVPFSYGASDDGAGTVAVLETARALLASPTPQRDVVFLLTDGEEFGLLGAQMFFDDHPLAKKIGVVVNAEARGSKGRASMFQTSPGNAALVKLWAENAISPSGNSMSDAAYRLLPNDTDLSVSLLKGIAGINAAYGAGHFDYHSTTDSFDTIDRGTLQHLGDFALTTTRALAMAKTLPAKDSDAIYFDVLGQTVVRYPPWLGWLPLVLAGAALILLYRREKSLTLGRKIGGIVGVAAATAALIGASHAIGDALMGSGSARFREVMAEIDISIWAMATLVLATLLLLRPGQAMRLGALTLLVVTGIAAQIYLPGAAFIFAWPALLAAGLLLARTNALVGHRGWMIASALAVTLVLAVLFHLLALAYIMIGLLSAGVMALALPFMIALLPPQPVHARKAGLIILVAAVGVIGWTAISDGFSKRHPRPGDFFAITNADDGKSYWATTSDARYLPEGKAAPFSYLPFARWPLEAVAANRPGAGLNGRLAIKETTTTAVRQWDIAIPQASRFVSIAFRPDKPLSNVRLAGRTVVLKEGEWTQIYYRAQQPITLKLTADASDVKVAIRYRVATDGLPKDAPRSAGLRTNWTLFSGTDMVVGEWRAAP